MNKQEYIDNKQVEEELKFTQFAASNNINRYNYTPVESSYDVKMQSGTTYFIGEIKVRDNFKLNFFEKYGPFLEYKKASGMMKEKEELNNKLVAEFEQEQKKKNEK
jgi:hypothetical protein